MAFSPFLVFPLPLSFPVVPGGRVAMIAVWTPLSPKYRKEVTGCVTMFPVAFGTHIGCCIESCLIVVCLAFCAFWILVVFVWFGLIWLSPRVVSRDNFRSSFFLYILLHARSILLPLFLDLFSTRSSPSYTSVCSECFVWFCFTSFFLLFVLCFLFVACCFISSVSSFYFVFFPSMYLRVAGVYAVLVLVVSSTTMTWHGLLSKLNYDVLSLFRSFFLCDRKSLRLSRMKNQHWYPGISC